MCLCAAETIAIVGILEKKKGETGILPWSKGSDLEAGVYSTVVLCSVNE